MRIAISTSKGGLDDSVCSTFGRCPTFTLVEVEDPKKEILSSSVIPNPGSTTGGGAGVAAAQEVVNVAANAVITGNCGPNALIVLKQANVDIFLVAGNVGEAVKKLMDGKATPLSAPSVPGHFGMGPGFGPAEKVKKRVPRGKAMRIVVSSKGGGEDGEVSEHFGRCPEFVLFNCEDGKVLNVERVPNPHFETHVPGAVPKFLSSLNVDVIISGGLGQRAASMLNSMGIKVVTGAKGRVKETVSQYLSGDISQDENFCEH